MREITQYDTLILMFSLQNHGLAVADWCSLCCRAAVLLCFRHPGGVRKGEGRSSPALGAPSAPRPQLQRVDPLQPRNNEVHLGSVEFVPVLLLVGPAIEVFPRQVGRAEDLLKRAL